MAVKYCNSQSQRTIGSKQTEKCQLVDVRFAKIAKDVQRQEAPALRRAQRDLAKRVGAAPLLVSKQAQMLFLCNLMHRGLERDAAENNGVLKAARSAGMLHYLPTSQGLRRADGPEWADMTSGSSRLPAAAWATRESWVKDGIPELPDWSKLLTVQRRLQAEARDREEARKILTQGKRGEPESLPELPLEGFKDLDPAGFGEPVAMSESKSRDLSPCFPGMCALDLFNGAGLLGLMHPRERRRAWREALERVATPAAPTKASKQARKRDCRMLQKEAKGKKRDKSKALLRALAADSSVADARASLVPVSGKKRKTVTGKACKARKQAKKNRKRLEEGKHKGGAKHNLKKAALRKGGAGKLARKSAEKAKKKGQLARMLTELRQLAVRLAISVNGPRHPPPLPPPAGLPPPAELPEARSERLLHSELAQQALRQEALLRRMEAAAADVAGSKVSTEIQIRRLTAVSKELRTALKEACPALPPLPEGASGVGASAPAEEASGVGASAPAEEASGGSADAPAPAASGAGDPIINPIINPNQLCLDQT